METARDVTNKAVAVLDSAIDIDREDHSRSEKKVIKLHDFWWDKVILTIIVLLLGVTSAQTIASYLQGDTVKCYISDDKLSLSVQAYINEVCTGEIPTYGKYFELAIFAEVSLLSSLQVFWILICNGRHESFKSAVSSMKLTRNTTTGQYEASDLETVRYLEGKLGSSDLFSTYILFKLVFQFIICVTGISVSFIDQFEFSDNTLFKCTNRTLSSKSQWPLSSPEIPCSYNDLSNAQRLRWFNTASLAAIMIAILCGVIYLSFFRHWRDYKTVAKFMRYTGLRREHFVAATTRCCCCCYPYICTCRKSKHISYDLMFQLLRLYGTNYKTAGAVFSILIENHLGTIIEENFHNYSKPHVAQEIKRVVGHYNDKRQRQKPYCVLVTHENDSFAHFIDPKNFERIVCFNFNPHITHDKATLCKKECLDDSLHLLQIPAHLWLRSRTKAVMNDGVEKKIEEQIEEEIKDQLRTSTKLQCKDNPNDIRDVVYIFGPISEEFFSGHHTACRVKNFLKIASRTTNSTDMKTLTIIVHPIKIANKDVSDKFCGAGNITKILRWLKSGNKYWVQNEPYKVRGVQHLLELLTDNENVNFDDLEYWELEQESSV